MFLTLINTLFGIGLFVNGLLFLPQAFRLVDQGDSKDISLITFIGFCITQFLAVVYGYLHHDYILMIGYIFALTTCGIVTVLAIFYRIKPQKSHPTL
ncbi:MAG: hypothetical protein A3F13_08370 [Gammaproteobacteria bacterium RIFCSPHIGHO2_12_FULL_40_19]|nr:MAG: hypothetical protein A3F13_08370 [Gammaproteobacteria bacterium RIFCSPHIGHO2_12_FULL_40_19]